MKAILFKPKMTSVLLAFLFVVSSGCGKVQLDLDNLRSKVTPGVKLNEGAEFVAASQSGHKTLNGYTIQTTTGSSFGRLEATTANGYKVYTTMQGRLISEEQEVAAAKKAAEAAQ